MAPQKHQRTVDLEELTAALKPLVAKLYAMYSDFDESKGHGDWEDFADYKGNGRWAVGALSDIEKLDVAGMSSREEVLEAAKKLLLDRRWDSDYVEPVTARNAMIKVIDELRAAQ
jgi:hypothetical protein